MGIKFYITSGSMTNRLEKLMKEINKNGLEKILQKMQPTLYFVQPLIG